MTNQERRNLVVEERAGDAGHAVLNVHAALVVLGDALRQIALEVCRTVLVGFDLNGSIWTECRRRSPVRKRAITPGPLSVSEPLRSVFSEPLVSDEANGSQCSVLRYAPSIDARLSFDSSEGFVEISNIDQPD